MAESTFDRLQRYFTGRTVVLPSKSGENLKLKTVDPRIVGQSPYWKARTSSMYGSYLGYRNSQYHRLYLFREYQMMEKDPIIARSLDILSEEATLKDEYGEILKIECDDEHIKITLEHLFYEVLNVDFNLRNWIRGMLKFGDLFLYLNLKEKLGVVDVTPLETSEVNREENEDSGEITFSATQVMNTVIPFERMAHFRNTKDQEFLPYGTSILESIRKYWKMQTLLEDFMMVYYLLRSVNQRVFRVDVGGLSRPQAEQYVQRVREMFKKEPLQDSETGEYNLKYDPLTMIDDIVLPVRQGYDNTTFDEIPASTETDLVQGIEYLRQKIMAGLGIPNFLLNYEETINSKCLHPDTKIKLLSGKSMSIKEISNHYDYCKESGEEFNLWTYTYNEDKDIYEPSRIKWAEKTRKNADLVKVTFDNGGEIMCTPDHGFVKKGGGKVQAKDLKVGQSVQSMKTRLKSLSRNRKTKYEQVYQYGKPKGNKWVWTHKLVDNTVNGKINKNGYGDDGNFDRNNIVVVHHKDFNSLNNNPENLQRMNINDHHIYHVTHSKNHMKRDENRYRLRDIWLSYTPEQRSRIIKGGRTEETSRKISENNLKRESHLPLLMGYKEAFPNGRPDLHGENSILWVDRPKIEDVMTFIAEWSGDINDINGLKKLSKEMGYSLHVFEDLFRSQNINVIEFFNEWCGTTKGRPCWVSKPFLLNVLSLCEDKNHLYEISGLNNKTLKKNLERHNMTDNEYYNHASHSKIKSVEDIKHIIYETNEEVPQNFQEFAKFLGMTGKTLKEIFQRSEISYVEFMNENFGFVKGRPRYVSLEYFEALSGNYDSEKEFFKNSGLKKKTSFKTNLDMHNITYDEWKDNYLGKLYNQKVVSVEQVEDRVDTYNMEVDHPHHNYVTDCFITIYNSTASSEDIRFGKTVEKIQNLVVDELEKIAVIHLILQGYEKKDIYSFNISLTPPSDLREMEKLEKLRARLDLARDAVDSELFSKNWVYKNIFQFGDDEILDLADDITNDKINQQVGEKSIEKAVEATETQDEEEDITSEEPTSSGGEGSQGGQLPAPTKDTEQEEAPSGRVDQLLQSRGTGSGTTRDTRGGARTDDL